MAAKWDNQREVYLMLSRRAKQREKKRQGMIEKDREVYYFGSVNGRSDPTARAAINALSRKRRDDCAFHT
jgi:hypothetical protein